MTATVDFGMVRMVIVLRMLAGRAAGTATLSELVIALSKSGIPVLSGSSGEGWVTVRVAPAQMIPALELTHTAYLRQRAE